jgi:hypothetical protein
VNYILSFLSGNIIYTEYAGILMAAEKRILRPPYIVGYAVLEKAALNKLAAVGVIHLAKLYFVIDF